MSNTITVTDLAAKTAVAAFHAKGMLPNTVFRGYEADYKDGGYETGESIRVRKPARFSVVSGATAEAEDIVEDSVTITVAQKNVSTRWTSIEKQLKLNPKKLAERVFTPMANALIRKVEIDGFETLAKESVVDAGNSPGAPAASFLCYADAVARLQDMLVPDLDDIYGAVTPSTQARILDNNKGLSNPSALISNQYVKGRVKDIAGVNMYSSQSIYRLLNGTIVNSDTSIMDTVLVTGTSQTMASVGASKTVTAGMAFTVAGVYAVDPETRTDLPWLKVFRVSTAATSSGGGALTVVLTESVVLTGSRKNVSGAGSSGAAVTWINATSASASSYQNLIYHKMGAAFVGLPMVLPEQKGLASIKTYDGISIRAEVVRDGITDAEILRMDILYGWKALRPEWIATAWGE
jgi:hypothetical protein